jgi:precorrin-2 methylase
MTNNTRPHLFVVGLGVSIPDHITVQAFRAMSKCDRIYTIVQEPQSVWLPKEVSSSLEIKNALDMYEEGAIRSQNYERVAETILRSLSDVSNVGYITYGNPLAFDSVAQSLVRAAPEAGIECETVPGICSADTLLCDLGTDMAPGIQVFEASWLVAAKIRLDVSTAAILLQLGTFGSLRTHYRDRRSADTLAELTNYLGERYGLNHRVSLVQSSGGVWPARICQVSLGDLCTVATDDFLGASMYLPALHAPKLDDEIIQRMRSL